MSTSLPAFYNVPDQVISRSTGSISWPNRLQQLARLALIFCSTLPVVQAQTTLGKSDKLLVELLESRPELFGKTLSAKAADGSPVYDVQIVYTQINRDAANRPSFKTYRYQVDKDRYFYPASTVKFPAVLLALETLNTLGLPRNSPMLTDSAYAGQTSVRKDATAKDGFPSVAQYARKILLVSDNDAFNRLYELIGQCAFNDRLAAKGYANTRIVHRLSVPFTAAQNAHTNPVRFVGSSGTLLRSLGPQFCERTPQATKPVLRGTGYKIQTSKGDSLVKQPFDFTTKNAFPLEDQQAMLRALLFPEAVDAKQRFNLTPDDYRFVYQYMSQLPRETRYPNYQADTSLYDSYCKFLMVGDQKSPMPKSVRIFNKVGDAYGYILDNAYIVDFEKGIEFMLSAVIACNSDGVFNDDKYDYETVGFPFMGNLGRLIYDYEASRKKPRLPDLSQFKLAYSQE
ncbi:serine hydrolase [uncultured Fibrella sp.]|uniref:serine hydrolase n=1 Tax=uncultured Fibrella sp. TaxID=1284596 RepID=UPI0035CAF33B